jgi:hypothetical protein
LTKEVEFQELEIQLSEKQIKEKSFYRTQERSNCSKERFRKKSNHLKHKKSELDAIMDAKEEAFLSEKSLEYQNLIEDRLLLLTRELEQVFAMV